MSLTGEASAFRIGGEILNGKEGRGKGKGKREGGDLKGGVCFFRICREEGNGRDGRGRRSMLRQLGLPDCPRQSLLVCTTMIDRKFA